jgi:hypothetical protein
VFLFTLEKGATSIRCRNSKCARHGGGETGELSSARRPTILSICTRVHSGAQRGALTFRISSDMMLKPSTGPGRLLLKKPAPFFNALPRTLHEVRGGDFHA